MLSRARQPRLEDGAEFRHLVGGQRAASDPLNQDVSQTFCVSRCCQASARTCWEDHLTHPFRFLSEDLQDWAQLSEFWLFLLRAISIQSSHFNSLALSVKFFKEIEGFHCILVKILYISFSRGAATDTVSQDKWRQNSSITIILKNRVWSQACLLRIILSILPLGHLIV